jgi:hypothetical protein
MLAVQVVDSHQDAQLAFLVDNPYVGIKDLIEVFLKCNESILYYLANSRNGSIATGSIFTGAGRQTVRRNMEIVGKTVRVRSGPMKGYIGIVKDATDSTVKVELHTMPKVVVFKFFITFIQTVNFNIDKVMEVGADLPSGLMDVGGAATPGGAGAFGRTPMYGGAQTPMYGGAGAATPMHDSCRI